MRTGLRLREHIEDLNVSLQRKLPVDFFEINNRQEFLSCLEKLLIAIRSKAENPILHIECHGGPQGLQLADDSIISWTELKPILVLLNQATRCSLYVILAACHGAYLINIITPTDRAPCWGIFAPPEQVKAGELLQDFKDFYTALMSGKQTPEAFLSSLERATRYLPTSAETLFKDAYVNFLATNRAPDVLRKRARLLQKKLKKTAHLDRFSLGEIGRALDAQIPTDFERYRREFFMVDLYPENADRFSVSFDEVIALSRAPVLSID